MAIVSMTAEAAKQFDRLPAAIKPRVQAIFVRLAAWPNVAGAKPLRHELAGQFRIRTGDFRVQFFIEGDTVVVVKVGNRDRFYE